MPSDCPETDIYVDVAMLRAAGYYTPGVDPDEDMPTIGFVQVVGLPPQPGAVLTTSQQSPTWTSVQLPDVVDNYGNTVQPHPHAARPGAMPTVADLHNERNHFKTRAQIAEQKLADLPRRELEAILTYMDTACAPVRTVEVWRWLEATRPQEAGK